jgi:hydrogenase maturation protein HypF
LTDEDKIRLICSQLERKLNTVSSPAWAGYSMPQRRCLDWRPYRFEAELPMALESIAAVGVNDEYPVQISDIDGVQQWAPQPMIRGLIEDLRRKTAPAIIAARFHNTLCRGLLTLAKNARQRLQITDVALSGGVFCNGIWQSADKTIAGRRLYGIMEKSVRSMTAASALDRRPLRPNCVK